MSQTDKLLTPKELAFELKRPPSYVYAMVRRGFAMPGWRATLTEARGWLLENPAPHKKEARPMFGRSM
jgi:hypothetical protein